jgi:pimeloyl-ACP methyl ester carboxylesterase
MSTSGDRAHADASEHLRHLQRAADRAGIDAREIVAPRSEQVILGRMRFHYLDWGTEGRPTILFLHGGGLTAHTWDMVCLAMRGDYRCIAPDLRGHGDSEWSPVEDYELETLAADVARFADHLALERFVLVGMSLGGLAAIEYASDHHERLAGVVIVDIGPEVQEQGASKIRQFMAGPGQFDSIEDYVLRAKAFNPRRDEDLLRRSLLNNLRQTPKGKWVWKWDPRPRAKADPEARKRRHGLLWERIERIDCAALVMRGERSDMFHDSDAEKLTKHLPRGRWMTIADAGHTIQGDNPRGFVAALRPFLSEIGY